MKKKKKVDTELATKLKAFLFEILIEIISQTFIIIALLGLLDVFKTLFIMLLEAL